MEINSQIDRLISNLQALKASLANGGALIESDDTLNTDFKKTLELVQNQLEDAGPRQLEANYDHSLQQATEVAADPVPSWFNQNRPSRPSTMQLMEIISGVPRDQVFELANFSELSSQASELIYGVIGSKPDTRDWASILTSGDIVNELKKANGSLNKPSVEVHTEFSQRGIPISSNVVLKDDEGYIIREIQGAQSNLETTLENFGVQRDTLQDDLQGYDWALMEYNTRLQLQNFLS